MKQSIILLLFVLTSCASINKSRKSAGISRQQLFMDTITFNGKQEMPPTLFWSHYDISQRGGLYLVNSEGKIKVISENPPDGAINSSIDILAKAKVGDKIDAAAKFSAIKSVAELGQRNAANYMIRDLAFRIEALKNNHETIDTTIAGIYEKLIKSAEKITISETRAKLAQSKENTLKELTSLLKISKDTLYRDLKIDSTFIRKIGEYIDKE